MHVLSLPPAFALSQDQTLTLKRLIWPITLFSDGASHRPSIHTLHSAQIPVGELRKKNNRSAQVYSRQVLKPSRKDKRRPRLPSSFQLVKERPRTPGLIRGKQKTARQSRRPVPPLVRRWLSARSTPAAGADEPGYTATHPARQQGSSRKFRLAASLPCSIAALPARRGSCGNGVTPQSRHATSREE